MVDELNTNGRWWDQQYLVAVFIAVTIILTSAIVIRAHTVLVPSR